jgi:aminopeptidase-like protein
LVLACVGDPGPFTYKRSRRGQAEIDRAVVQVLATSGRAYEVLDFSPYGYDERQYCSPGFNLPVGNLSRTPHGRFPEYHTSADNLDLVKPAALEESLRLLLQVVGAIEGNRTYRNTHPKCEPQLGKRGLYGSIGGRTDVKRVEMAMLWVLNMSDGDHSLLDIAERSGVEFATIRTAADVLLEHELLEEIAG